MMCKKPFFFNPTGSSVKGKLLASYDERLSATPFGCGQCLPCRINKSRVWKHRILLESKLHLSSAFATLTYDDENLPKGNTVCPADLKNFIKRLRYYVDPRKIRFFAVGEYGDRTYRPHYHCVLFGVDPFEEKVVQKAWSLNGKPLGFVQLGEVNEASSEYIAGYVIKNCTNVDPTNSGRHPEFMRCSTSGKDPVTKGGIGAGKIREYARKLRKEKYIGEEDVQAIRHGKKSLPLGRYLQGLMDEGLGIGEKEKIDRLYKYQDEIFAKHLESGEVYRDSVVKEKSTERLQQEKRHKIFKSRRSL